MWREGGKEARGHKIRELGKLCKIMVMRFMSLYGLGWWWCWCDMSSYWEAFFLAALTNKAYVSEVHTRHKPFRWLDRSSAIRALLHSSVPSSDDGVDRSQIRHNLRHGGFEFDND